MYAEREQFEKQYYAFLSAAHSPLDANVLQHLRNGRIDTESMIGPQEVKPACWILMEVIIPSDRCSIMAASQISQQD
ncbi:hypothetical protein EVAR_47547_1 [Eumeta japonica]|uniref:Uncharacterized protein n=1 Tax=Eumeta variegata TaxID=151549 RepID=A0A4C1WQT5_EUMVA|nr:hypothetical protein EVAR_47547_1 [Eumeta japonica]